MRLEEYINENETALRELTIALCCIPAPSHQEDARARFCLDWFREAGFSDAYIDEAKNVICPFGVTDSNEVRIFMAHTDTVFPDTEPMPMREEGGRLYCPGVGDDTVNLALLMMMAKYAAKYGARRDWGMLFVANSCEEGLGNLEGCRELMRVWGDRVSEVVSFDGGRSLVVRAVGSERWRVTARTVGGHSYADFGNENAIAALAKLISRLYCQTLPSDGEAKTTYNVGCISGGTSVNTIAQQAEMLYEYRSDSNAALAVMRENFHAAVAEVASDRADISLDLIGVRPGMEPSVDPDRQAALIERGADAIREVLGYEPKRRSGSTDCNIPFSMGIPAVCVGLVDCGGAHTREEYIVLDSLADGMRICAKMMEV